MQPTIQLLYQLKQQINLEQGKTQVLWVNYQEQSLGKTIQDKTVKC